MTLDWTAPTNLGGGTLLGYKIEYATSAAYSSPTVASSLADPSSTEFVVNGKKRSKHKLSHDERLSRHFDRRVSLTGLQTYCPTQEPV